MDENEKIERQNYDTKQDRQKFLRFMAISTLVALVYMLVGSGTNLMQWLGARREIHNQEARKAEYRQEIATMEKKIKQLKSNRDSLEKYAREKFHFTEKGDDVFLVE